MLRLQRELNADDVIDWPIPNKIIESATAR